MPARPLRRLVAAFACSVCLLLPQAASAAPAAEATRGEPGAGPPTWSARRATSIAERAAASGVRWSDVPNSFWARTAIDFVGAANDWMRDRKPAADGTYAFEPNRHESRKLFGRTLFRAFGTGFEQDPDLTFTDLPATDRFYGFANVAVTAGWMQADGSGAFRPSEPVTMREVHRGLVLAIGMGDLAAGADALHLRNGTRVETPKDFGTLLIGMRIGLRYNHGDESLDVAPDDVLSRAEVAWSLYRATTAPSYVLDIDAPANRVVVGPGELLARRGLVADRVHWVAGAPPHDGPFEAEVRIRYRSEPAPAVLEVLGDELHVGFRSPQRGVAPGQTVVVDRGDELLGGARIVASLR